MLTRRQFAAGLLAIARPDGVLVDTHVHLFASDQHRFPYPQAAPYKPPAQPLEAYLKFVAARKINHTVIVHPEPYQDDHSYLEYCFANEPSPGFFKGTCLFDPTAPQTPARMEALVKKNPNRIVALRIHEMRKPGLPPTTGGAIKDRDMASPAMKTTWKKAHDLGLAIQMHFIPYYAPQIATLAVQFPGMPIVLDHLARAGQGTPAEWKGVLQLAKFPRIVMKYSGVNYSSNEKFPFRDAKPIVKQAYEAFGPDRIIWGGIGHTEAEFEQQVQLFNLMWDFVAEDVRAKIRGGNAMRLFRFA
jgi:predicted TIM-barrel fold metal-dependent hydrolase